MEQPQQRKSPSGLSALALVSQLGLVMALPIVGGVAIGVYMERRFAPKGVWLVLGILLGIVVGGAGVYRILAKEIGWKP